MPLGRVLAIFTAAFWPPFLLSSFKLSYVKANLSYNAFNSLLIAAKSALLEPSSLLVLSILGIGLTGES